MRYHERLELIIDGRALARRSGTNYWCEVSDTTGDTFATLSGLGSSVSLDSHVYSVFTLHIPRFPFASYRSTYVVHVAWTLRIWKLQSKLSLIYINCLSFRIIRLKQSARINKSMKRAACIFFF